MTAENLLTGLPELPDGYFWRVTRVGGKGYANALYLSIRRKVLFFSVRVEYGMVRPYSWAPTVEEGLRKRAKSILEDWQESAISHPRLDTVLGDYPPKKLEV